LAFAHATYDLTALAVIKNWLQGLTFVDMAWGTMVSGGSPQRAAGHDALKLTEDVKTTRGWF
jgi:hypothetical protein